VESVILKGVTRDSARGAGSAGEPFSETAGTPFEAPGTGLAVCTGAACFWQAESSSDPRKKQPAHTGFRISETFPTPGPDRAYPGQNSSTGIETAMDLRR
jgi:hypothetical protein